jgi:hypothetical protein
MAPYDRRRAAHQTSDHSHEPPRQHEQTVWAAPAAPKDPINVLVIGPTQNGKSTFINKFLSLSQVTWNGAEVGNGFESCTTECGVYEVDMPTTPWKMVDAEKAFDIEIPEDEETIFSLFARRKNMTVIPIDPNSPRVRLRLIDTPGLDDSKHRDAKNIQEVLQRLAQYAEHPDPTMRYIHVIIFIVSMHSAFSDSFQKFYEYYKKCMPNLFGGLAIVNTNFTVDVWKSRASAYSIKGVASTSLKRIGIGSGASAKNHIMKQRRTDFASQFECDPRHFFIDSRPNQRFPFEQLITLNTMTEIVHHFMAQGPMPIEHMRLFKFPEMLSIDLRLAGFLNLIKGQWNKDQEKLLQSATAAEKVRSSLAKWGRELDADIEQLNLDLERWDTQDEYKLKPYTTHDPSAPDRVWKYVTFSKLKNTLGIREQVEPFEVTTTDSGDARWTGKTYEPSTNTWTCRYEAKWRKVPKLTAQSWAQNRTYYAEQIRSARRDLRHKEAALLENKQAQMAEEQRGDPANDDPKARRLGELISQCDVLIRWLKADEVPLSDGIAKESAGRYGKELARIGVDDLMDMLIDWNKDFAQAARPVVELPEFKHVFSA